MHLNSYSIFEYDEVYAPESRGDRECCMFRESERDGSTEEGSDQSLSKCQSSEPDEYADAEREYQCLLCNMLILGLGYLFLAKSSIFYISTQYFKSQLYSSCSCQDRLLLLLFHLFSILRFAYKHLQHCSRHNHVVFKWSFPHPFALPANKSKEND